jgi:hypothetical protein
MAGTILISTKRLQNTHLRALSPPLLLLVLATCAATTTANPSARTEAAPPSSGQPQPSVDWPEATPTARPWTRWWWHGSAVDPANLTRLLEEYQRVGLGGVEITCIYAVKNNQHRNREYLSEAWVEALQHTLREATRLGMGVDLPAGSGWRMGGPSVTPADANSKLVLDKQALAEGEAVTRRFERATLQAARAVRNDGTQLDLSAQIADNTLTWQAPPGNWTLYTLAYHWAGDRVKRPGPGGAGLNINPFSKRSVTRFLTHFGETLAKIPGIRSQFHDSFEYDGDWQPEFLTEFYQRRGYRLEEHLASLAGDGDPEIVGRVKCDYRETLADLTLEHLVVPWVEWAHQHGQLARNQSHGSPANWLDLYAACDIPETESFGRLHGDDADRLVLKFAASAAHVAGRKLVSAESATWLDEHFQVTLAQIKQIVDRQILAGVNHVFYHGTAYSPSDAPWPGWLFYASTQLNPRNPIWRDLPALNTYLTRCQSVLQESRPDNDVLLYWPLHDAWHKPQGLRMEVRVHNGRDWFYGQPLGEAAELLQAKGYAFDYVSDRGLATCRVASGGKIVAPGGNYDVVVVPRTRHMPLATLEHLAEFARGGAKIVFWGDLPHSQPGLAGASPNPQWEAALASLRAGSDASQIVIDEDLSSALQTTGVRHEQQLAERHIQFIRKHWHNDIVYFLKNEGQESVDDWVLLTADTESAVILDPVSGQIGRAATRGVEDHRQAVRLQLAPGQSLLLRVAGSPTAVQAGTSPRDTRPAGDAPLATAHIASWPYRDPVAAAIPLAGPWHIEFIAGGPTLPAPFDAPHPVTWTESSDPAAASFAGTARYTAHFDAPAAGGDRSGGRRLRWQLDLGEVLGSARVSLNGKPVATLFGPPFSLDLEHLEPAGNRLEVEVTGVAANRIRDLDRRGIEWRIFEDINLVNIDYKPFDASQWPIRPLGLQGPITLTPLETTPPPPNP